MSSSLTVLVYEYFCGGGSAPGPLPDCAVFEALGMLWAVLTDFRGLSAVRTVTAWDPRLDNRIAGLDRATLPADEVVDALPGCHERVFLSLLKRCEAALIIAPETNGILSKLTAFAESAGIAVLGSSSLAAELTGNKAVLNRIFCKSKLPVPETKVTDFDSAVQTAAAIGWPVVIKPLDGVGSEGIFRANNRSEMPSILAKIRQTTAHEKILVQAFSPGIPVSVSLLLAEERCLLLSLNRQWVDTRFSFYYRGSTVPFPHPMSRSITDLALKAAGLVPGLRGYVGVDLMLDSTHCQVVEINPRLTTSYIGLRQVARDNLAQAICNAALEGTLPEPIPLFGQVVVQKDDPDTWNLRGDRC